MVSGGGVVFAANHRRIRGRLVPDFRLRGRDPDKKTELQTVFHVREAGYEVEKRINDSQLPLKRQLVSSPNSALVVLTRRLQSRIVDYSFYKEVIDIPVRPAWKEGMTHDQVSEAMPGAHAFADRFPAVGACGACADCAERGRLF